MTATATCLGCGHGPEADDRYCSACGLVLESADGYDSVDQDGDRPSTIRPDVPIRPTPGEPGIRSWLTRSALLAVLVVVGVVTWRISQPPTRPLDGVAVALSTIDARVPAGWGERPNGAPFVDLAPYVDVEETDDVPVPPDADRPDVTLPRITLDDIDGLDDQFLVLSNQTQLVRVDPANGAVDGYSAAGLVVGHHGGRLILATRTGQILSSSVTDPETEQTLIHDFERSQLAGLDLPGDGTITAMFWGSPESETGAVMTRSVTIDLETGVKLAETAASDVDTAWQGVGYQPGFGTFLVGSDGEERWLSDGAPTAVGNHIVMIRYCDRPDVCEDFWLDRESGERIDRETPEVGDFHWIDDVFGPDDRFVVVSGGTDSRRYFDTLGGAYLAGPDSPIQDTNFNLTAEVVTPDGRYLIAPISDGVVVHDLEAGISGVLPVDIPGYPQRIELVPKPGEGS